jgi:hypothetical protein
MTCRTTIVMPSNNCSRDVYWLAGRYEGRVAWLLNAYDPRQQPWARMQYAIDNGAYGAYLSGDQWDGDRFLAGCDRLYMSGQRPLWCAVPDVVCDADKTLQQWEQWKRILRSRYPNWPLAFVAQDGMGLSDLPNTAEVIFIGGSTLWKREVLREWPRVLPRVHVGRINTWHWLMACHDAGVESIDGTGWVRHPERLRDLERYLQITSEGVSLQQQMNLFRADVEASR